MTAKAAPRQWNILLVEDNVAEARLTRLVLQETALPHMLRVARDGQEALAMLRREGPHQDLPLPDLVLLDLNLPRIDGREILSRIKSDVTLRFIPVLVLSNSGAERDVLTCYRLHANGYLQKPPGLDAFTALMKSVTRFWFGGDVLLPVAASRQP